jgi:hypothetical protein
MIFREQWPTRTYAGTFSKYTDYKPYLAEDFNHRCGYTDCPDFWFGGKGNFHIDHFIPWKKHLDKPKLKTEYSNLVYTCSYVNIAKSNDEGDYIDPCYTDFNQHFQRDNLGNIIANPGSIEAVYMFTKLKLYLKRYQIIWMLENLFQKMDRVKKAIESTTDQTLKDDLRKTQGDLGSLLIDYLKYLKANQ